MNEYNRYPVVMSIEKLGSAEIALGLLFGWILSFPLYGPWLSFLVGAQAESFGMQFLLGHVLGLIVVGLYPSAVNFSNRGLNLVLAFGLMICTLLFWQFNQLRVLSVVVFLCMGAASAALVLWWSSWFARQASPWKSLAIAMVLSNMVLLLSLSPIIKNVGPVLALLPVLMVYMIPHACDKTVSSTTPTLSARWFTVRGLAAFAIVTHFVGGLWYKFHALPYITVSSWSSVTDGLLYVIGVLFCWWWLQKTRRPDYIALLCLSTLGLGLIFAQAVLPSALATLLTSGFLSLGLSAADFFYWCGLWALAQSMEPRKVFGLGLGFALVQKLAASLVSGLWGISQGLFALLALALIFLLLPFVVSFGGRVNALRAQAEETRQDLELLTDTEKKVFALLSTGATDADICEELLISRHTVKFHVRNILRKLKAPNRKVLLSRLTSYPYG